MQIATQLLITAQMLINLVIANPSLPADVKLNALNQAFTSITNAQAELNRPQTTQVDTVTQPVQQVAPVLQTPTFGSIIKSMNNQVTISKYCQLDGSQPELQQLGCNLSIEYTENGYGVNDKTLTITSDGQGSFVNYNSPQFISTSTNQILIKTKSINGVKGKQQLLYIQPNKTEPNFTVSIEGVSATQ